MTHRTPVILIADRDRRVRELQEHFLARAGLQVEFADDGQAALDRAAVARPGVIVTEILLPKLDGLALCRRLREDPATRATPIVVFSILAAADRARDAGANLFLRKPFVDTTFVAAIQGLIESQPTAVSELA
jgi:CheY-like chemotaxis protein